MKPRAHHPQLNGHAHTIAEDIALYEPTRTPPGHGQRVLVPRRGPRTPMPITLSNHSSPPPVAGAGPGSLACAPERRWRSSPTSTDRTTGRAAGTRRLPVADVVGDSSRIEPAEDADLRPYHLDGRRNRSQEEHTGHAAVAAAGQPPVPARGLPMLTVPNRQAAEPPRRRIATLPNRHAAEPPRCRTAALPDGDARPHARFLGHALQQVVQLLPPPWPPSPFRTVGVHRLAQQRPVDRGTAVEGRRLGGCGGRPGRLFGLAGGVRPGRWP
ncbi:hypothetical protein FHX41_6000 [Actinomadura hallensis]|uniref:Uncharacterized protein n=1 Tax=Actinomadura hallensis TaxID=337895 RepID=A0A543INP2_9ACTN|nr:hypothetical protein FHX41_6000 [Actinomadura hallensis]